MNDLINTYLHYIRLLKLCCTFLLSQTFIMKKIEIPEKLKEFYSKHLCTDQSNFIATILV